MSTYFATRGLRAISSSTSSLSVRRVEVEQPPPAGPVDLGERAQQVGEARLAVEVAAVRRRVLRDEVHLAHAAAGHDPRVGDEVLDRAAREPPAERGDRAEGALLVAALADLQVRVARRRQEDALAAAPRRAPGAGRAARARRRRSCRSRRRAATGRPRGSPSRGPSRSARRGTPRRSRPCSRPSSLRWVTARIVSTDSSLAGSMKPQVLTSARSASSMPSARANPAPRRSPTSRSLSARFFAQPSERRAMRPIGRGEAVAMGRARRGRGGHGSA